MIWEEYRRNFIIEANKHNKTLDYCDRWLSYAKNLYDKNLPIIYNNKHFSELTGYNIKYLYKISNKQEYFYKTFYIDKKNGGKRRIDAPYLSLKDIQKWILENILYKLEVSNYSKAYIRGKSIKDNVKYHKRQKIVMTIDIHDYFGSIKYPRVLKLFMELGYTKELAVLLSNLCTLNRSLPQGAPTSPYLSNLISFKMDTAISKYTNANGIRYTRYADDMTFSGGFNVNKLYYHVNKIVESFGFVLNEEKTRTRKQGQQQEVSGLVVNEKVQIPKSKRKELRQELYYIKKYGIDSHIEYRRISDKNKYVKSLFGKINYAIFINKNYQLMEYRTYIKNIIDNIEHNNINN